MKNSFITRLLPLPMKTTKFFCLLAVSFMFMQACTNEQAIVIPGIDQTQDTTYSIDTRGYWESGEIVAKFDCPDSRFFPPIDIKKWDKIAVVNGRLPTYKETLNGTSIHTYVGEKNMKVKPYNILLPKLAYFVNGPTKMVADLVSNKMVPKPELVVVIQVVQTPGDTLVGFRYLTGGVGGSYFRDFRFLTDEEIKNEIEESIKHSSSSLATDPSALPAESSSLKTK